jgi:hypothetical protein
MYSNRLIYAIRTLSLFDMFKKVNILNDNNYSHLVKYVACISDEVNNQYNIQQWSDKIFWSKEYEFNNLLQNMPVRQWDISDMLLHKENLNKPNYVPDVNDMCILWDFQLQQDAVLTVDLSNYSDDIVLLNKRIDKMCRRSPLD